MSLIRWAPMWDPFEDLGEAMTRLPSVVGQGVSSFVPAVNVYQTDSSVVVEAPLAGVDPKDVEVSVQKGVLTIKGESKKEHEVQEKDFYRKEVRSGSFYREIALPAPVAEDKVTAEFENGLLKVTAPKMTPAAAKKISVTIKKK